MKIISRKEAREQHLQFFFTGIECDHGHLEERYVSVGKCKTCLNRMNKYHYKKRTKEYNKRKLQLIEN
jgi:hypothetical protein